MISRRNGLQVARQNLVKMHQFVLFLRGQQRTQITFEQQQISHGFRGRFAQTDVNLHQIARKYSTLVYNMAGHSQGLKIWGARNTGWG